MGNVNQPRTQEMDEKLAKTSLYFNMKGFRWAHAKRMSEIAISLYGVGRLTAEQKAWLRGCVAARPITTCGLACIGSSL